jgi:tRNA G18 (ribose-2'-O)-methylase SpoU
VDGGGDPLHAAPLPDDPLLLLGTERHGLSPAARDAADTTVAIEMRAGVSSLNLATAAAVVLYAPRRGGTGTGASTSRTPGTQAHR